MSNTIRAVAGSRLAIGGPSAGATLAAFQADTYTEILGIFALPPLGYSYPTIALDEVRAGPARKLKGAPVVEAGDVQMYRYRSDPGQIELVAASRSDELYNFRLDASQGEGVFERSYFQAYAMGRSRGFGGPNDTQNLTVRLEPDDEPITLPDLGDGGPDVPPVDTTVPTITPTSGTADNRAAASAIVLDLPPKADGETRAYVATTGPAFTFDADGNLVRGTDSWSDPGTATGKVRQTRGGVSTDTVVTITLTISAPAGFTYLADADGSRLTDPDGAYLMEAA